MGHEEEDPAPLRSRKRPRVQLTDLFGDSLRLEHREARWILWNGPRRAVGKIVVETTGDHLQVLHVKPEYRGYGLGALLFQQAVRDRESLTLEAEEDAAKHQRLVQFYETLGCHVKPHGTTTYLYHQDQVLRKVPMEWKRGDRWVTGCALEGSLVPLVFVREGGTQQKQLRDPNRWVLWDTQEDGYQLQCVQMSKQSDPDNPLGSSGKPLAVDLERDGDLWSIVLSDASYLTLASNGTLDRSKTPSYWRTDRKSFSLHWTADTPHTREQHRLDWLHQTVHYVQRQRERGFSRRESLTDVWQRRPQTLSMCIRAAECVRQEGHPDWVQLLALLGALGRESDPTDDDYDWTQTITTRVLGCAAPSTLPYYADFSSSNVDEVDPRTNSLLGLYKPRCGLQHVLLSWTPTEYMYWFVKHNEIGVPEDGLQMFRLAPLVSWHTDGEYSQFEDEDDKDLRSMCADLHRLLNNTVVDNDGTTALNDANEHERLWVQRYLHIAIKYGADGMLEW